MVQGSASSTTGAVPARQPPMGSQVSAPLQALPSEQLAPVGLGSTCHPVIGSHVATWQLSPIIIEGGGGGVPGAQAPCWQVSAPLHTLASAQLVPFATGLWDTPPVGSQASAVHGLLS